MRRVRGHFRTDPTGRRVRIRGYSRQISACVVTPPDIIEGLAEEVSTEYEMEGGTDQVLYMGGLTIADLPELQVVLSRYDEAIIKHVFRLFSEGHKWRDGKTPVRTALLKTGELAFANHSSWSPFEK